ncbi:MAG: LPS assembly protein LptD [Deltaproteobacteria bacterium]|jgi:LPS-assembly protein|nr:LPS assembly protein LptD [Deltaproteobacteria bacterium]
MSNLLQKKYMHIFVIFTLFYILIFPNRFAAASYLPENPEEISWHISAMTVTFDQKRDLYIAEDNVVITGGKTRLEADYVEFSNKTKDAFARGNVLLISREDSISCNAMTLNLITKKGFIDKGTIFIQKNNFYISGENIQKTGESTYSAKKGSITSCEGEIPDWKITGNNIKVTIEGYGTATNTVFWAKKLPVIYSPYLKFPVKRKRQTGFLLPKVTSSDRRGFELEQPLFLSISKNSDATVYADYMSDRGVKLGTEFRYILDKKTKGSMNFDFLDDEKIDDGTNATEDYSFSSTPQRTNEDRFWFRMKHDQDLPDGFTAKLDIDVVSDEDYLHEFQDGFTGYRQTKKYFEKEFGRSLDEYDDYTRQNKLNINKVWSNYAFNIDAIWYDNVRARRQNTEDTTLQTLPAIMFNASRQQVSNSKLFYTLNNGYRSFYRQDTTDTLVKGQRANIYPKIYLPMKLGRAFHFEPSLGIRETIWHTNDFTDIYGNSDSLRTRHMYDIGATLSTKLNKIFNVQNNFVDKILHELIPKLEYAYTPHVTQDDLPFFDDFDRIEEQNLITWSLTNNFISRSVSMTPEGEEKFQYRDFAYVKIYQDYDINKEKDNEPRPFSDISLELEFNPYKFITLYMDLDWSPYDDRINLFNISNTLKDRRGDALTTEYRFEHDQSESIYAKIAVNLTHGLNSYYSIEQNLMEEESIETKAGLSLKRPCWIFDFYFSQSSNENSVAFMITLNGIGGFGTND